ncbi:MAG: hypothetical protein QM644_09170 [Mobilitalea sp.]
MKKGFAGILGTAIGLALGVLGSKYFSNKKIDEKEKKVNKFKDYYQLLNQWLTLKQEGQSLEKYFIDHGYRSIAIYGMGELGNRLYNELKNSEIEVKYAIDQYAGTTYSEIEIVELDGNLEEVDIIVVTSIFAYDEIKDQLEEKVMYPVVSLEDVVFEL